MRRSGTALLVLLLAACAPRAAVREEPPAAQRRSVEPTANVEWPERLLVGAAEEPALFRRSRGARAFAWVAPGVELKPRGAVRSGRVRAIIDGPLSVRGWIPIEQLEAVVLERGRVAGSPLFLLPGDRVRLRGVDGARAEIEAHALLAHPQLSRSPSFRGSFPLSRLGVALSGGGEGSSPGRAVMIRRATELRASPDGEVQWSMPAFDPPLPAIVLRERGEMLGVRIGMGPYLVGYVPASALEDTGARKQDEVIDPWRPDRRSGLSPATRDPWGDEPEPEAPASAESPLPPRLQQAVVRPVWHVRAGARLEVEGVTMAIFREPGFAVELERAGDRVEVLAAVDDTVKVRGTVPVSDLRAAPAIPSASPGEAHQDDDTEP
jgi:hypothetical protein